MQLDEAIKNRRSIRKYKDKEVTKEQILEVLDAGNRAPSAKNRVQWRFHVFLKESKSDLIRICREELEKLPKVPLMSSAIHTFNVMEQAPVVILVYQTCEWGGISAEIQSVSAAIQNMLLKAHSMKLGALWINDVLWVEPAINKLVGIKKEESEFLSTLEEYGFELGIPVAYSGPLVAAVTLGHPDEDPKRDPKKTLEEITTWYN